MAVLSGLDGKLYRNSATFGSPTWVLIPSVKDVTRNGETNEGDGKSRISNFMKRVRGLKKVSLDFDIVKDSVDAANWTAIRAAWLARATVEFAFATGLIATAGTVYVRFAAIVTKFSENQPLEDAVTASVSIKLAYSANEPSVTTVGS